MSRQIRRLYRILPIVIAIATGSQWLYHHAAFADPILTAQTSVESDTTNLCPSPALSQVQSYTVGADDTLASVAAEYNLLPITILGMNPTVQPESLTPGTTLRIPPFNGIEVSVTAGQTWQDLATSYQSRADVLFEVNGCPETMPDRIFVPGVNWFPGIESSSNESDQGTDSDPLTGYPLPQTASILTGFGWQTRPDRDELFFSSGVTLAAGNGTSVLAAGDGIVAYVGQEEARRTLIVINHAEGLQTRYALVNEAKVSTGDQVVMGQEVATTAASGGNTALYFEVRINSDLGWVARDPGDYIPELAVR